MQHHDLRKHLEARAAQLKDERSSWDSHWQEIVDYLMPFHGRYLSGMNEDANPGGKKHSKIMDSTGEDAMEILAAGMQSGITSPARPWFRLGVPNRDLQDLEPVKVWLHTVQELMREIFSQSNVYDGLHQTYKELGGFGTAVMLVLEDFDSVVRVRPMTVGEYWIATDARGRANTIYRRYPMTAVNMVDKFGIENVSAGAKSAYENKQTEKTFHVWHAIEPNDKRVKVNLPSMMKYRSVYWEESAATSGDILAIEGFKEFPALAPRWAVVAVNVYGNCPGMKVLADIKMLQSMQTKSLKAIDLSIDKPVTAPASMKTKPINTMPGGITYYNAETDKDALRALYDVRPEIQQNEYKIERVQAAIRRGLFNDLFLMLSASPTMQRKSMTATEVAERHEEKLLMLGPVLERLHSELLNPLIDTTFNFMVEAGLVPDPPEEIAGMPLKVEYISLLAQAQKIIGLGGIEQFSGFVGELSAVVPEALDRLDVDEAIEEYAEAVGVPPRLVRSMEKAEALRSARAQRIAAQEQMANAGQMAQGAKVLSEADTGGNNALTALTGVRQ